MSVGNEQSTRSIGKPEEGIGRRRGKAERRRPKIIVELIEGRTDQLRHWLADGNLDVAVADFTGMPTGVELVDFYQERMVLVIANSL